MAQNDPDEEMSEGEPELVDEELTEVFRCGDEIAVQIAIDEILAPSGIPTLVHNRASHAFPAPASMPGGYFIAVPVARAAEAAALLREAQEDGALSDEGEVAQIG
jgi:hypothetical protein